MEAAETKLGYFLQRTGPDWLVEWEIKELGKVVRREKLQNPGGEMDGAVKMAEKFHGRKVKEVVELSESEDEDLDLAEPRIVTGKQPSPTL